MRLPIRKISVAGLIVMMGAVVLAQNGKSGFEAGRANFACMFGENSYGFAFGDWQVASAVHPATPRRLGIASFSGKKRGAPNSISEAARKRSMSNNAVSQKAPGAFAACPYSGLVGSADLDKHPNSGSSTDRPELPVTPNTNPPRVGDDDWSTVRYWLVS